jgi:archaellum component FlaC
MATLNQAYGELQQANVLLGDIHNDIGTSNQLLGDINNDLGTANGLLGEINSDLGTLNTSVQAVGTDVQQVDTDVQYTNKLLTYQIEQNNTIICYLEKITRQTCALLNESARQTAAQEEMARDIHDLEQLYELANPAAAVEQDRLEALKHQVERCCPPPKPEPPCKFEPCQRPGDVPPPPSQSVPGPPVAQIARKTKKAD